MKALSIKQPWASLIAHGIKDVENRTWKTNYRGRVYIHASAKNAFNSLSIGLTPEQKNTFIESKSILSFDTRSVTLNNSLFYPISAIIGEVDVVDCVINHPSIWAEQTFYPIDETEGYPNKVKPIYNWVLANPVLYNEPILNIKGKLSLWEYNGKEESNG